MSAPSSYKILEKRERKLESSQTSYIGVINFLSLIIR